MKKSDLLRWYSVITSTVLIFVFLSIYVLAAEPQGPDSITPAGSGRHTNNSAPAEISARAGNLTAITINSVRNTQAWQGYYGNVTGTIVLDDASNFTLYDWSLPNPAGEIYASNFSVVTWSNIYCMNVSSLRHRNGSTNGVPPGNPSNVVYSINSSEIEVKYGINATDKDGLNETFNDTYPNAAGTTSFQVGGTIIDSSDGCSLAHPYANQGYSDVWEELLLTDNASIIFTALIRENAANFQSAGVADFQMLVLENEHSGHENTDTTYYFFVELT